MPQTKMPRILKRRSDQISRETPDLSDNDDDQEQSAGDDSDDVIQQPGPSRQRVRGQDPQYESRNKRSRNQDREMPERNRRVDQLSVGGSRSRTNRRQNLSVADEEACGDEEDGEEQEVDEDEEGDEAEEEDEYVGATATAADREAQAESRATSQTSILVKKLVRLALATEYSRTPLRRTDITAKIFRDLPSGTSNGTTNNTNKGGSMGSARNFKNVFNGAQRVLQGTFGMQLVELPSREKTSLKERRIQAIQTTGRQTQTQNNSNTQSVAGGGGGGASSKSWILVSTLPKAYKLNPAITTPSKAPSRDTEAEYTAMYTFILALIYLNNSSLPEQKLERYLKRVNADNFTPFGTLDKLLARMAREGYVERRRDTSSGEEVVEWVIGPRGKVEVGVHGVVGFVKQVYGFGMYAKKSGEREARVKDEDEEEELNAKLGRSLGIKLDSVSRGSGQDDDEENEDEGEGQHGEGLAEREQQQQRQRGGTRGRSDEQDDETGEDEDEEEVNSDENDGQPESSRARSGRSGPSRGRGRGNGQTLPTGRRTTRRSGWNDDDEDEDDD